MAVNEAVAFVVGDSHYAAIAVAAQNTIPVANGGEGNDICFFDAWKYSLNYEFSVAERGEWILNPELKTEIERISVRYRRSFLFSVFGGGHHHALTLIEQDRPLDCLLPTKSELPVRSDAQILTVRFLKDIFLQLIAQPFREMNSFRHAFPTLPYSQLESPAPIGDDKFILQNLGKYFEDSFSEEKLKAIVPSAVRYKSWVLQSEMYREECEKLGIVYMPVPPVSLDTQGFLKPEYYGADSTHANPAYGRLILDNIESRIGGKLSGWTSFG